MRLSQVLIQPCDDLKGYSLCAVMLYSVSEVQRNNRFAFMWNDGAVITVKGWFTNSFHSYVMAIFPFQPWRGTSTGQEKVICNWKWKLSKPGLFSEPINNKKCHICAQSLCWNYLFKSGKIEMLWKYIALTDQQLSKSLLKVLSRPKTNGFFF